MGKEEISKTTTHNRAKEKR